MTYNTPELLLVGPAQDLVLGTDPQKIEFERNTDNPGDDTYEPDSTFIDLKGW